MIRLAVERGEGDKEASPLQDDRIVNEQMAIRLGANHINERYYKIKKRTINCPHRLSINDGIWVLVDEGKIPIHGKHYVKSVTISGDANGILNSLEIEEYEEP